MTTSPQAAWQRNGWPLFAVWSGAVLCVAGWILHRMWTVLPANRFAESLLLAGASLLLAWPLRRWRGWEWADALALVWGAALVVFVGPLPVLAAGLLAGAALAAGSLLVGGPAALVVGLGLIAGTAGWLLPLPVHQRWGYFVCCCGLIFWRRHPVRNALRQARAVWRAAVDAAPRAAAGAVLLAGLASTGCWLPTMQYDDLVYHLGLPWQLQLAGRYALDPTHQVWALSPWAGDVLHAIAQLLAGREARGAVNLLWLIATAGALHALVRRMGGSQAQGWAAVALFASLPLTTVLAANMQTEGPAAAVLATLAWLVLDDAAAGRRVLAGAVLFGLLLGLKSSHAVIATPLLLWAGWRHRACLPWRRLLPAAGLALLVGGSSYLYAWQIAGNPVLPLFNAFFRSPYFPPVDFVDARWRDGFDGDVPWDLTFDTEHYMEGWDGAFGFVLVAMLGAYALALRDSRTRALALAASAGMLMALVPMQYARYLHPSLVLLLPALTAALPLTGGVRWLVVAVCALDLAFVGNASWILRTGAIKDAVRAAGRDAPLLVHYAPERLLASELRSRHPGSLTLVLGTDPGALAELGTAGRTTLWYAPVWRDAAAAADADASGRAWAHLLRAQGIRDVLLRPATLTPAQHAGLDHLAAYRMRAVGSAEWWRIPAAEAP